MELDNPISVNFRGNSITLSSLHVVLVDDSSMMTVDAHIRPFPKPLRLWEGSSYADVGDYTQDQAEARIRELLGANFSSSLAELDA